MALVQRTNGRPSLVEVKADWHKVAPNDLTDEMVLESLRRARYLWEPLVLITTSANASSTTVDYSLYLWPRSTILFTEDNSINVVGTSRNRKLLIVIACLRVMKNHRYMAGFTEMVGSQGGYGDAWSLRRTSPRTKPVTC